MKEAHAGAKGFRLCWLDESFLLSTGFTKKSDREISLWDLRKFTSAVQTIELDTSPVYLLPFYDPDTRLTYIVGKVGKYSSGLK